MHDMKLNPTVFKCPMKILTILIAMLLVSCGTRNPAPVAELLDRIGGEGTSGRIETQIESDLAEEGKEVFEIGSRKGKPFIQGSSMSALTAGIGWYLNHYVHVNLSWNNLTTDLSGVHLPVPAVKERRTCSADYRYYLNYCTYSYSMAFWTRERWEKEIDWMALHGINLPLALVGTDVVWKNMLEEIGYSRAEIDRFIAGPGFQAWWLMYNLEGWGGPNPDWWYKRQEELCSFILGRMRELGMEPVLPGYCGLLPSDAADKLGVKATDQGYWCSGFTRPSFLVPTDEKFDDLAEIYYRQQEKVMGKSRYYSMDPFHEGGSTGGIDLKGAYNAIYSQMRRHSPDSRWVIQSWQENPRKEALEAVPQGGYLVLDLFSDGSPKWMDGYDGHDFLWCMLHNFGGRVGMHGRLDATMKGYSEALKKYPGNMKGIGATPEGIETNPILYDALFELPWMTEDECADWIGRYSEARYGTESDAMKQAWELLASSVLACPTSQQGVSEPVVCARPSLDVRSVSAWSTCGIYHDVAKVRKAAAEMLEEKDRLACHPNYRYDLTDVVRQALTDSSYFLLNDVADSWKRGDKENFRKGYEGFLDMMRDMDRLLSQTGMFSLRNWVGSARDICDEVEGTTDEDRDWMEWNARTLISVWGPEKAAEQGRLHDYSNRQWGGMIKDFYLKRWEKFFKELESGVSTSPSEWFRMEEEWTRSHVVTDQADENPEDVAEELFKKYF